MVLLRARTLNVLTNCRMTPCNFVGAGNPRPWPHATISETTNYTAFWLNAIGHAVVGATEARRSTDDWWPGGCGRRAARATLNRSTCKGTA